MSARAGLAAGALTLAFAIACAAFVRQPTLATFADDSVSYLVMAQVFSPWQAASRGYAGACMESRRRGATGCVARKSCARCWRRSASTTG